MVNMKNSVALTLIAGALVLSACGNKKEPVAQNTPTPAAATQSMTPAAEPSQDDAERAKKLELLDYATNVQRGYKNVDAVQLVGE
jgi:PBP1b-binding outer membrane lipoprotein LpoB